MNIRTVTLELLRAGPPHNQLLSPLTQYLGVCGESGAGVVTLPYEHAAFERRLRELRYEDGTDDDPGRRLAILGDTGSEMGRILGSVPGLAGALAGERQDDETLTHLRLVLSASELALLPFELSKVPTGARGPSDSWLALQTHVPVCITRHIRSVPTDGIRWPRQPRILFVAGDTSDIPFEEHKEVLCEAIEPWLYPGQDADPRYGGWLTILENATFERVRKEFSAGGYTHVHILAHGADDENAEGTSFGIALLDEDGDPDVVSGERFASALSSLAGGRSHRPTVVTMASCDSANVGSVQTPGASFAHDLHQAGIPLVVASQFPLGKSGSIELTRTLYRGLLWGDNPWVLLHRARTELHGQFTTESHDWASLVVYEALPGDLDQQLEEVRYRQGRKAANAALKQFDDAAAAGAVTESRREELVAQIDRARERLLTDPGPYQMECLGLRASSRKRQAEVEYRMAIADGVADDVSARHLDACYELLEDAFEDYRQASQGFLVGTGEAVVREATLHWVLVQALSLATILGRPLGEQYWMTARLSAEMYLEHPDVDERGWAHGSLAELWLLRLASEKPARRAETARRAEEHAARLVKLFPRRGSFHVFSTQRQFARYAEWWGDREFARQFKKLGIRRSSQWAAENGIVDTAKNLVKILATKVWRPPE